MTRTRSKKPRAKGQIVRRVSLASSIAIGDRELALGPDRLPDGGELGVAGGDRLARPDQQRRGVEGIAQISRQRQGILRGRSEPDIASIGDPTRPQNQRLDLVLGEH